MDPKKFTPNSHCHFCGHQHGVAAVTKDGGRRCINCRQVIYQNSLPVAVLIAPCGAGSPLGSVFTVRRGIEPFKGQLALPGGYIMVNETWEAAACREGSEELGLHCRYEQVDLETPKHIHTESSKDGSRLLTVGYVRGVFYIAPFKRNEEALERVVFHPESAEQLCFPIHQTAIEKYWKMLGL